jgi:hypothetical protein
MEPRSQEWEGLEKDKGRTLEERNPKGLRHSIQKPVPPARKFHIYFT